MASVLLSGLQSIRQANPHCPLFEEEWLDSETEITWPRLTLDDSGQLKELWVRGSTGCLVGVGLAS